MYAKTVTLGSTHWPETNRVLSRNRRIGCSISGIAEFIAKHDMDTLKQWVTKGYDEIQKYDILYSNWFCIPRSIKTTSVKPSGTVSLLAGTSSGIHYPESRFYKRRVRLSAISPLCEPLKRAGYHIEPSVTDSSTLVVTFPVAIQTDNVRTVHEVSMWEQLELCSFMQQYYCDNQVSCTVTFDPITEGPQIKHALDLYQYRLKGISFLPRLEHGAYAQMPMESITEDQYKQLCIGVMPLQFHHISIRDDDATPDRFCDGESCTAPSE